MFANLKAKLIVGFTLRDTVRLCMHRNLLIFLAIGFYQ